MLVNKIIYNVYLHNLEGSKFFWSMKVPGLRWWACSMKPDLKTTFEFCTERMRTFRQRNSDSARKEILPKAGRNATTIKHPWFQFWKLWNHGQRLVLYYKIFKTLTTRICCFDSAGKPGKREELPGCIKEHTEFIWSITSGPGEETVREWWQWR